MKPSNPLNLFFQRLEEHSLPAYSILSEEEQSIHYIFAEETSLGEVEIGQKECAPVKVRNQVEEIKFEAFLDGIQRTILWRRFTAPNGALVPIHLAYIAAGVILRNNTGKLLIEPDLITSRFILLGPFEGLGVELPDAVTTMLDTNDNLTFGFPETINEWVICDTTFWGTDENRAEKYKDKNPLRGKNLFNEGLVRSRAQGRVATLRQRLEFAVLAKFRNRYPEKWILVDGPLFFIDKWRRPASRILSSLLNNVNESNFENKLLKNAVGLIKTNRLRPKHPDQVAKINLQERSPVFYLLKEVDIKGHRDQPEEEGNYGGAHLTWYTRLRPRRRPPYGLLGLVRIDTHRVTFRLNHIDNLNLLNFGELQPLVDGITKAIWKERWPAYQGFNTYRSAAQVYPIEQLERVLKRMAPPKRFLASFAPEQLTI